MVQCAPPPPPAGHTGVGVPQVREVVEQQLIAPGLTHQQIRSCTRRRRAERRSGTGGGGGGRNGRGRRSLSHTPARGAGAPAAGQGVQRQTRVVGAAVLQPVQDAAGVLLHHLHTAVDVRTHGMGVGAVRCAAATGMWTPPPRGLNWKGVGVSPPPLGRPATVPLTPRGGRVFVSRGPPAGPPLLQKGAQLTGPPKSYRV